MTIQDYECELYDPNRLRAEMDAAKDAPAVSTPVCARCNGRGRVEVKTIAGRMLDACPDCTQPNEFF